MQSLARRATGLALLPVATLLVGLTTPTAVQEPRPNVLVITLDTVRADRLGAYGYEGAATPNLDRLAREGVLFTDATTQSPLTAPAHAALFTGMYPTGLGIKINGSTPVPDGTPLLAEMFSAAGYRTGGFIGAFVLDRQYGFARGFERFDASFQGYRPESKLRLQRRADDVVAPAISWLGSLPADARFFAWLHFYDAHTPYEPPAPFAARFKERPYDGEIAYVDAAIGRLLASIPAGTLDRTLVLIVGDHGESLGEHGEDEHGVFLYEGVLRIPWIVRLPNSRRAGTVVREQVRSIDFTPTVLDLAGLPTARRFDGESVAPVIEGQSRRDPPASYADAHYPQLHFGWSMLRSLRVPEWKYIDAPRPELYDLRTDRSEARNVLTERAPVAARMSSEIEETWRRFGPASQATTPQPDPETLARLRSLGYAGIAAPASRSDRGPDPKDKIGELAEFRELLSRALDDLAARRTDAALARLKRAVAINERAYDVHVFLGDAWRQKGEPAKALGEYEAAALLNPSIAAPHVLAADVHRDLGHLDRAMERIEVAASLEPESGEVAFGRGRILDRAGRHAEALEEFQRAVSINPADAPARGQLVGILMNQRRYDRAEPHLRVLLELGYQPARTHFALGHIAESRGDLAAAAAEYRRALVLDPHLQQARAALERTGRP